MIPSRLLWEQFALPADYAARAVRCTGTRLAADRLAGCRLTAGFTIGCASAAGFVSSLASAGRIAFINL